MKKKLTITMLSLACAVVYGQPTQHPWHVVDRGGCRSAGGGFTLSASIGQPAVQMGSATGFALEGGFIPGARLLSGTTTTMDAQLETGWNMVSVPLIVSDYRKTVLYPASTTRAFTYQGVYVKRDTLKNGIGYWIKFSEPTAVHFSGTSMARETVSVIDNWNMIGCPSYPSLTTDIIPLDSVTLISKYWRYSNGYYVEDTLKPGKAYWIKVRNAGRIVLNTGSVMQEPVMSSLAELKSQKESKRTSTQLPLSQAFDTITLKDAKGNERSLYFSLSAEDADAQMWEMPPVPFEGIMDVRFASNRMLEVPDQQQRKEIAISISSAEYPLTLSWKTTHDPKAAALLVDGKEILLTPAGETHVTNPKSQIKLSLIPASGKELPKEYALDQNYPNPFNPLTVIRYQLPVDSKVALKIYNVLGQEVRALVDEIQDAGYKSVEWNAHGMPSGVYFYCLSAGAFADVKKMMVLK